MEMTRRPTSCRLLRSPEFPSIEPGADLVALICDVSENQGPSLADGDVVVVAQKIVSKAEERYVDLATVNPGERRWRWRRKFKKTRGWSRSFSASRDGCCGTPNVLIVEHKLGFVLANAGIDQSNVDPQCGMQPVLLLPEDPDRSARRCAKGSSARLGKIVAMVINDSFGRAWRLGTVGVALGAAGLAGAPAIFAASRTSTGGPCKSARLASPMKSPRRRRC